MSGEDRDPIEQTFLDAMMHDLNVREYSPLHQRPAPLVSHIRQAKKQRKREKQ